jgi:hypothetical protein
MCRTCRGKQRREEEVRTPRKRKPVPQGPAYLFAPELVDFTYGSHPGARAAAIQYLSRVVVVRFNLDAIDGAFKGPVRKASSSSQCLR